MSVSGSSLPPLPFDAVEQRFRFAAKRQAELVSLNGGDLPGADSDDKQRLVQELFFHPIGAVDVFAQYAVEQRSLRSSSGNRSVGSLVGSIPQRRIPATDPLCSALQELYINPDKEGTGRVVRALDPAADLLLNEPYIDPPRPSRRGN